MPLNVYIYFFLENSGGGREGTALGFLQPIPRVSRTLLSKFLISVFMYIHFYNVNCVHCYPLLGWSSDKLGRQKG